jgi:hypothetical protein
MRIENIYGTRKAGEVFNLPQSAFATAEINGEETGYVQFQSFEATSSAESAVFDAFEAEMLQSREIAADKARRAELIELVMADESTLTKSDNGLRQKVRRVSKSVLKALSGPEGLVAKRNKAEWRLERALERRNKHQVVEARGALNRIETKIEALVADVFKVSGGMPMYAFGSSFEAVYNEYNPLALLQRELGRVTGKKHAGKGKFTNRIAELRQQEVDLIRFVLETRNGAPKELVDTAAYQHWCRNAERAEMFNLRAERDEREAAKAASRSRNQRRR